MENESEISYSYRGRGSGKRFEMLKQIQHEQEKIVTSIISLHDPMQKALDSKDIERAKELVREYNDLSLKHTFLNLERLKLISSPIPKFPNGAQHDSGVAIVGDFGKEEKIINLRPKK
jgi:hypothetical protein